MTRTNFIQAIIESDLKSGKCKTIITRFPPEPNGYLHIGHAKAICIDFGMAQAYSGRCHLRFDDTNPSKEAVEYVDSIQADVKWLGFDWGPHLYYASDYFDQMHDYAIQLIKRGYAYVCHLNNDQMRDYRGTLSQPGKESPYRNRSADENLTLFEQMRSGVLAEGECVLRAKIDMASPNINMRDPIIYRILKQSHHHTGDKWCIYPMYDYAHCLEDMIEGVTHSLCSLEFEDHRPLYDWFLDHLDVPCHPQQIEFARLNLTYTVLSKRKLIELVETKMVEGWDDPRMPTLAGLRRRGYTPSSIRTFCDQIGVAKANSMVDVEMLQFYLREELNKTAVRRMAVLNPLKLIITNYPENSVELLTAENNPEDAGSGRRQMPFSRELYIEQDDFMAAPPKQFHRLYVDNEVRLNHAYYVKCTGFKKDETTGEILEVYCTYDPQTKGGWSTDGRKVKGSLHWVSAAHAFEAQVNLYEHLFTIPDLNQIGEGKTYSDYLNPNSLTVLKNCKLEPALKEAVQGTRYQFLRKGYFWLDPNAEAGAWRFLRMLPLKDTFRPK